ncbi:hypothetical protein [Sphingopyxis sp. MWB1]|uniref:hypothetical protein n=1 Tax=Sphingopyxis sp. MWB1 TaxID=1537715 RepID=UPI000AAE0C33|nr:hypothetical protein [Sphingopyxis sp. MWB1]
MKETDPLTGQLSMLGKAPLPDALDALDDRVLGALETRRREAAAMRRMLAIAAFVSLGGGMVAGSVLPGPAVAASPLTPLAPASPLAPAALLGGGE